MIVSRVNASISNYFALSDAAKNKIKETAYRCFKELAFAFSLALVISNFVTTSLGLTVLINAKLAGAAISIIFHSIAGFANFQAEKKNSSELLYRKLETSCNWICAINFAVCSGYDIHSLVHESGHALAALLLYKNPRPIIEIFPFKGGITQHYKNGLSVMGRNIGAAKTTFCIFAAGPGLTLLISTGIYAIGLALRKHYPTFSKYLLAYSVIDFIDHSYYAYSALHTEPWNLLHDFNHLSIFGLDPAHASIGIISIPIIVGLGMYIKESWGQREKKGALNAPNSVRIQMTP